MCVCVCVCVGQWVYAYVCINVSLYAVWMNAVCYHYICCVTIIVWLGWSSDYHVLSKWFCCQKCSCFVDQTRHVMWLLYFDRISYMTVMF